MYVIEMGSCGMILSRVLVTTVVGLARLVNLLDIHQAGLQSDYDTFKFYCN
jgi:hypothetical protein